MKIIAFSLLFAVVVSVALSHPTPHQSSVPSSIEAELAPVPAAIKDAQAYVDEGRYRVQTTTADAYVPSIDFSIQTTVVAHVDKRNYHVQTTTTAEIPEVTYPTEPWPEYKRKREHKNNTEAGLANSIDATGLWNVIERRADENDLSPTPRHTPKPKTKTKQPPVKPTIVPKRPPHPGPPPPPPLPVPTPTPSPPPAPAPGPAELTPPAQPTAVPAMITNNAAATPEPCRSVTLTWKMYIDKSERFLRWRHEISYSIERAVGNSFSFLGGTVVQDQNTGKIGEGLESMTHFTPGGDFGVKITPVGRGTGLIWFWRGLTRVFAEPNAIVPYSGDDMKYGYEYWDCVPAAW
ncbi:hypothetical protein BG015_007327 [Linnemannia schmuckeri]|uniref:Uncharacterized protein n=1 Tax=Linnemannia schmuckeri TaxID=64567 RepID=A0A9P5RYL8_9FUNG|nr:hypothetical protein BG015_007327 [Linnemannia schmuckeri]